MMTLKTGSAFYIMTSARDILLDVYVPALEEKRFSVGLFVLCRYSLMPFAVGLLVSGIRGRLLPYDRGDCADYTTWLEADRGNKEDRTSISESNLEIIDNLLGAAVKETNPLTFKKHGNILYPEHIR